MSLISYEIANRIKACRMALHLSYQDLADKTGLSKSTLQRYETGKIMNIPLNKLEQLATTLETTPCCILGLNETKKGIAIMRFSDIPQFTRSGSWQCDFDLQSLVNWIKREQTEENLQLNPDFQRGHVWTEEQQIAFLKYFLKGGKSGTIIYLNKPDWHNSVEANAYNDFVCVDGLQRITAATRFINNEIPIFGTYFRDYEDRPRMTHTFKVNVNDLKSKREVLQWYIDMNAGGTPHTAEEIQRIKNMMTNGDTP